MSVMATLLEVGIHEFCQELRAAIRKEGSLRAFAREYDFSAAFVSDVMLGKRMPSPRLLAIFGFERVIDRTITYRRKRRKSLR